MTTETGFSGWLRLGAVLVALLLAGCVTQGGRRSAQGTSVMQFLYPTRTTQVLEPGVAELALPLRVGVAFVPPGGDRFAGYGHGAEGDFGAAQQARLLEMVAEKFRALPFVADIQIIPGAYLRPGGGFENLEQLRSMFGVEVIALVAYDQVQFTDENFLSLAYWTIVGAYVVQGEKNDTQTLMDATVYDIASRRLLFRAPGTSRVKAHATLVGLDAAMRKDREEGLRLAAEDLTKNLEAELAVFRQRVRERPAEVKIVHRPGYSGAGAFEGAAALAVVGLLGWAGRKRG
jgi:rhombotail lipoprotein